MNLLHRQVKKGMAALLSAALLVPAWTGIALAEEKAAEDKISVPPVAEQVYGYTDTVSHWSNAAVEKWSGYGIIQGYGDGIFKPDQPVTRAEFAAMLQNISQYVQPGNNSFSDVSSNDWFYEAVTKLKAAGIMEGSDGKAHPGNPITRQEAAVLLARTFKLKSAGGAAAFSDKTELAPWASAAVGELATRTVLKGFPDGSFRPLATLTRAEATSLFDQFLAKLYNKAGTYNGEIKGNALVNAAGVTLKGMTITGDLYIAQGVGEGEINLDGVTVNGAVYIQGGGEHSLLLKDAVVKGVLAVNKYNGKVRIVASGNSRISSTLLETGATLETRQLSGSGYDLVTITTDVPAGQKIALEGSFNKVTNQSAVVSIMANGTIKELVAETSTNLKGEVKVEKISAKDNAAVTINDKPAAAPVGGGFGGGGFGGGAPSINVTGVSLNETNVSMQAGTTKQLAATVTPSNAANKAVTWRVNDGSSNVITVDHTGLVTAKSPGVKEVVVQTQSGGFEAKATITVKQQAVEQLGVKVTLLTTDIKDPNAEMDGVLMENGKRADISGTIPSGVQPNEYSAVIRASQPLVPLSVGQVVYAVYGVIQLTDGLGRPLADTSGVTVTVNGAVYNPHFGEGINEKFNAGSFLYLLDTGNQETITSSRFDITKQGYAPASLQLQYMPAKVVSSVEGVFGELEKLYLGANPDKDHILGNMLLWSGLDSYPLVNVQWSSSNPDVISANGNVKRLEQDQTVTLTATLSGEYTGSKSYQVIVKANKMIMTRSSFTDSYFAEGYPKAYMKNGTVHVQIAFKRPAEMYSVMSSYDMAGTVDSVLKGYGKGSNSSITPLYDWPYAKITQQDVGKVLTSNTGFQLGSYGGPLKMDFVVKDGNRISEQVTTVQVQLEEPFHGYVPNYDPATSGTAYWNQERNAIYIYFNKRLDPNYLPTVNDFTVEGAKINDVTIFNDDWSINPEAAGAYVKLSASMNNSNLPYSTVQYTGKSLRSLKTGVRVASFNNQLANSSTELTAVISSDRKMAVFNLQTGWRWVDNEAALSTTPISERISVKVNGRLYPATVKNQSDRYVQLAFNSPLPSGTIDITYRTEGLMNWAREPYPAELQARVLGIPAPGIPTASYQGGFIQLNFAQGFIGTVNPYMYASGLVVEADGVEYGLRGHIIATRQPSPPNYNYNIMDINLNDIWSKEIKQAVDQASVVRIKYKKVLPDDYSIYGLSDTTGGPVPDFDYVKVSKQK